MHVGVGYQAGELHVPANPVGLDQGFEARPLLLGAEGTDKPVMTSFLGTHGVPEAFSSLR